MRNVSRYGFALSLVLATPLFASRWEYKEVPKPCRVTQELGYIDGKVCASIPVDTLNQLGKDGWELATCPVDDWSIDGPRNFAISTVCVFKRALP